MENFLSVLKRIYLTIYNWTILLAGLVRSPITATLPQIGSRLFVTWGILWSFPETRTHVLVSSLVVSWLITEIIRYSFFGTKEALGFAPSWLLWLRDLRNTASGCQTNLTSYLITSMLQLLPTTSMSQALHICINIYLSRGRNLSPNPRESKQAVKYFYSDQMVNQITCQKQRNVVCHINIVSNSTLLLFLIVFS
ncbi:hypothetical protein MKX03_030343 [Papaver bracteatum]|nr:hypothetical protein MKX03_030343 [Papaver bracteatum]